jgi:hypothetical protein
MILIQEPYITVTWDEKYGCVIADWHQNAPIDIQGTISMQILELVSQYRSSKLLVDSSLISEEVSPDFQKWFGEVWLPAATKAGLKNAAFIVPRDYLVRLKFFTTTMKYQPQVVGVSVQFFNTKNEATEWLNTDNKPFA